MTRENSPTTAASGLTDAELADAVADAVADALADTGGGVDEASISTARTPARALPLHDPSRTSDLDAPQLHAVKAAALSRALWLLLRSAETDEDDPRDREALRVLSDEAAFHASAAAVGLTTPAQGANA